jgi:hypothetical protein
MAGIVKTETAIGGARIVNQVLQMKGNDKGVLDTLRGASTALSLASLAPVPVVSPVLKGLSTAAEFAGDVIDPKVSSSKATRNLAAGAAGTVASIVPGGAIAANAIKYANYVDKGIKTIDTVVAVADVAGASSTPSKTPTDPSKPVPRISH